MMGARQREYRLLLCSICVPLLVWKCLSCCLLATLLLQSHVALTHVGSARSFVGGFRRSHPLNVLGLHNRGGARVSWQNINRLRFGSVRGVTHATGEASLEAVGNEHIDVRKLVARCVQLGEEAGARMREVQARPSLDIVDKGGEVVSSGEYVIDPQTAADREVEELCVSALMAEFPGIAIVAEETATEGLKVTAAQQVTPITEKDALRALSAAWPAELTSVQASRVTVYIDPLDGTGEFVEGNLVPVTNLLGVAVDGVPVAGVINQPWAPGLPNGRTIWGGPGAGVYGADTSIKAPQGLLCTNRVVRSNRCAGALAALGVTSEADARRTSATGYNFLGVIEGLFPLFVLTRHGTKKWDSCAGEALLLALGGIVTDAIGRRYFYSADPKKYPNHCGLLAARDSAKHAGAAQLIKDTVAPWPLDTEDGSIIA